jgi:hypothetical protein
LTQREGIARVLRHLRRFKGAGVEAELLEEVEDAAELLIRDDPNAGNKAPSSREVAVAMQIRRTASEGNSWVVRRQMIDLAREYEQIRKETYSSARTRRLEVVVTKMRALAFAAAPLVGELTQSPSEGERLAAIAILQMTPDPSYFDWLASRFGQEAAFAEYHAGVALLAAAQSQPVDRPIRERLIAAIDLARARLKEKGTDRERVLDQAERLMKSTAVA